MNRYDNPRLEIYYPIENRKDFFKYAVMEGNEIAIDFNNNKMLFDSKELAENIVKARLKVNEKLNNITLG